MKRPHFWPRWFFLFIVLIILAQYLILTLFFPRYAIRVMRRLTAGQVSIDMAKVSPRLTTLLVGLRAAQNSPESAFSVEEVVLRPQQLWLVPRLLEIASIDVERPFIRFSRTQSGASRWPRVAAPSGSTLPTQAGPLEGRLKRAVHWLRSRWRIKVNAIRLTNGTVEFIDEKPAMPFHLALENITASLGPVSLPDEGNPVSFALRGLLTGYEGKSAPVYCSGWIALKQGNLNLSCQLEPLALSIFDSYFQERPVIRVYSATLASTSKWSAKAHQMEARIQLKMDNFNEGDISVRGHTIFNIKRLAKEGERRLVAEISLSGAMQDVGTWTGEFIPSNEVAKSLVGQMLERRIKILKLPLGAHRVGLRVASSGEGAPQEAEATSKSVSEALELLAEPIAPEPAPVPSEGAAPESATPPVPLTENPAPLMLDEASSAPKDAAPVTTVAP